MAELLPYNPSKLTSLNLFLNCVIKIARVYFLYLINYADSEDSGELVHLHVITSLHCYTFNIVLNATWDKKKTASVV